MIFICVRTNVIKCFSSSTCIHTYIHTYIHVSRHFIYFVIYFILMYMNVCACIFIFTDFSSYHYHSIVHARWMRTWPGHIRSKLPLLKSSSSGSTWLLQMPWRAAPRRLTHTYRRHIHNTSRAPSVPPGLCADDAAL